MNGAMISTVPEYVDTVLRVQQGWHRKSFPWFRGQPVDKPLVPRLFREKHNEFDLFQYFRAKSPALGPTPAYDDFDSWLFLMQHHGVPTRCLDWTEGALVALYFAIDFTATEELAPVVWTLNPIQMNRLAFGNEEFPLKWYDQDQRFTATLGEKKGTPMPIAMYPTSTHLRLSSQKGCFTIHGSDTRSLEQIFEQTELVTGGYLVRIQLTRDIARLRQMLLDLRFLGITRSSLFPDFDGLSQELAHFY